MKGTHSTPFEVWYGYSPNVKYFKVYGRKCYIIKDKKNGKFDTKSEESIFLGYSIRSKAYKCLNTNTNKVVESTNVKFDEYTKVHNREVPDREVHNDYESDRLIEERRGKPRLSKYIKRHHPDEQIIGDKEARPMTRNRLRSDTYFLSMHEL